MQFPQLPPSNQAIVPAGPLPPQFWSSGAVRLRWAGAGNVNNADNGGSTDGRFTKWNSPVFDFRASFGDGQMTTSPDTSTMGTTPIYSPSGSLYVLVNMDSGAGIVNLDTLNITSVERANPLNPSALYPITSEINVTTVFSTGTPPYGLTTAAAQGVSGLGIWSPPMGGSGPVRFWQFNLFFRRFDTFSDPTITVFASYY